MKARTPRAKEKLVKLSEHVRYEYDMLRAMRHEYSHHNGTVQCAILESFCTHARNLFDFLYPNEDPDKGPLPKATDILAQDFFHKPEDWRTARPRVTASLEKTRERVNKEVAHLTEDRLKLTDESRRWFFNDISRELEAAMTVFQQVVPAEHLDPKFWPRNQPVSLALPIGGPPYGTTSAQPFSTMIKFGPKP